MNKLDYGTLSFLELQVNNSLLLFIQIGSNMYIILIVMILFITIVYKRELFYSVLNFMQTNEFYHF